MNLNNCFWHRLFSCSLTHCVLEIGYVCACVHDVHIQEYIGTCLYNISIKAFPSSSTKTKEWAIRREGCWWPRDFPSLFCDRSMASVWRGCVFTQCSALNNGNYHMVTWKVGARVFILALPAKEMDFKLVQSGCTQLPILGSARRLFELQTNIAWHSSLANTSHCPFD